MFSGSCPVLAQQINLRQDLCLPLIVGNDDLLRSPSIPIADNAFLHRKYRFAFNAYYQFFFCFNDRSEMISPEAEDSGAASTLREAVSKAYDGHYDLALHLANKAFANDERFGEAMLIAGNLQWVLGHKKAALSDWDVARNAKGYPTPSDTGMILPLYARSASGLITALRDI
jgi:hypothetical protein